MRNAVKEQRKRVRLAFLLFDPNLDQASNRVRHALLTFPAVGLF